ncbi:transcriptional regulator [[Pseudopropionibacterium] massiliense]|uniref:transcriptional regulator n=1 Tax=[Pseudopropionibacterium] massiliense TaxID=2220000 RepID=UPI001030442C|nr:transcriptional regulator [[Pseudopropionibacterium] massiliense]
MTTFDETIHSPNRLRICAALSAARQVEFAALLEGLGVSKSLLSKQLKVLIDAGYVTLERKPQRIGRPRTWVGLTAAGRKAYRNHVAALRKIIEEN